VVVKLPDNVLTSLYNAVTVVLSALVLRELSMTVLV